MKRIFLFLVTNLAIVFVLSIVLQLVGFEGYLDQQGIDLNISSLLVFSQDTLRLTSSGRSFIHVQ